MSFVTTPSSIENAFKIQISGDPLLAELYGLRQPAGQAVAPPAEQPETGSDQANCAAPSEAN